MPYEVKENDTIFGLAIKLDVSEKLIREINDLSGNIYPGMVPITLARPSNSLRTPTSTASNKSNPNNKTPDSGSVSSSAPRRSAPLTRNTLSIIMSDSQGISKAHSASTKTM